MLLYVEHVRMRCAEGTWLPAFAGSVVGCAHGCSTRPNSGARRKLIAAHPDNEVLGVSTQRDATAMTPLALA